MYGKRESCEEPAGAGDTAPPPSAQPGTSGEAPETPAAPQPAAPAEVLQAFTPPTMVTTHMVVEGEDPKTAGIPKMYQPTHSQGKYWCPICKANKGGNKDSAFTHVRREHLKVFLACPKCPKMVVQSSKSWMEHMGSQHGGVQQRVPATTLATPALPAEVSVKIENVIKRVQEEEQEVQRKKAKKAGDVKSSSSK